MILNRIFMFWVALELLPLKRKKSMLIFSCCSWNTETNISSEMTGVFVAWWVFFFLLFTFSRAFIIKKYLYSKNLVMINLSYKTEHTVLPQPDFKCLKKWALKSKEHSYQPNIFMINYLFGICSRHLGRRELSRSPFYSLNLLFDFHSIHLPSPTIHDRFPRNKRLLYNLN